MLYVYGAVRSLLAWAIFAALCWLIGRAISLADRRIRIWVERESAARGARGFSLVLWNRAALSALWLVKIVAALFVLFQLSFVLSYTFAQFPLTSGISTTLLDYLKALVHQFVTAVVDYLPSGGIVLFTAFLTYYLLRLLNLIAHAVEHGDLRLPALHPEMARPTYQIARILIILFALVVSFPYLPGGHSDAFKGISIMIGVLISFGSGSAVSNVLAGIVLTYMRPYKIGDRVKIADTSGDVIEKTLLVTRIRTVKNVEVVIPNSAILNNQIFNLSANARTRGLILHTTVTIGYNTPWQHIHSALIEAALMTDGILADPRPFVLQTALNDYHISYELNASTDRPNEIEAIYSRLHQNTQDAFARAGIEIMSPSYLAMRDGNPSTIPPTNR